MKRPVALIPLFGPGLGSSTTHVLLERVKVPVEYVLLQTVVLVELGGTVLTSQARHFAALLVQVLLRFALGVVRLLALEALELAQAIHWNIEQEKRGDVCKKMFGGRNFFCNCNYI